MKKENLLFLKNGQPSDVIKQLQPLSPALRGNILTLILPIKGSIINNSI